VRPEAIIAATGIEQQRVFFDQHVAPIFDKKMIRWLTGRRASLFGLGIPPAQYEKLAGGRSMADVLIERLRRLACDFPISENYFAWQAFARRYDTGSDAALPPYLQRAHFDAVKQGADRIRAVRGSLTTFLENQPKASVDRFILLDAQDWMDDAQLNALWSAIARSAAPGARVIFRTAAEADLLPGRVTPALLERWCYQPEKSRELAAMDRSAIYGGFHLYCLKDDTDA
jgi:S-adenosylmethionine-diacylglycerol 3-amino-3-carboxypropyl transferase